MSKEIARIDEAITELYAELDRLRRHGGENSVFSNQLKIAVVALIVLKEIFSRGDGIDILTDDIRYKFQSYLKKGE